jgi:prolipoprotein diacylglyceryltransferase
VFSQETQVLKTRVTLFFAAIIILFYPIWGVVDPVSFLNELIDRFPYAEGASDGQIRQASLILMLSNLVLSIAFATIAMFISKPNAYVFAKVSAIAFIVYPILRSICEFFIGRALSQHTQDAAISVGISSQSMLYMLFGLIIFGIVRSQRNNNL